MNVKVIESLNIERDAYRTVYDHLRDTGWRALGSTDDRSPDGRQFSYTVYAKNGRLLVLQHVKHGPCGTTDFFEVFVPVATTNSIADTLAGIDAAGESGSYHAMRPAILNARERIANLSKATVPFKDPLDGPVLRELDAALAAGG